MKLRNRGIYLYKDLLKEIKKGNVEDDNPNGEPSIKSQLKNITVFPWEIIYFDDAGNNKLIAREAYIVDKEEELFSNLGDIIIQAIQNKNTLIDK